jgi:ribosomal protein L36
MTIVRSSLKDLCRNDYKIKLFGRYKKIKVLISVKWKKGKER